MFNPAPSTFPCMSMTWKGEKGKEKVIYLKRANFPGHLIEIQEEMNTSKLGRDDIGRIIINCEKGKTVTADDPLGRTALEPRY